MRLQGVSRRGAETARFLELNSRARASAQTSACQPVGFTLAECVGIRQVLRGFSTAHSGCRTGPWTPCPCRPLPEHGPLPSAVGGSSLETTIMCGEQEVAETQLKEAEFSGPSHDPGPQPELSPPTRASSESADR